MPLSLSTLEELRGKYLEMSSMRAEHDARSPELGRTRQRMLALATRHPGALRELDGLEIEEIHRRIREIDTVIRAGAEAAPWMHAIASFHRLTRGALSVKRWLGRRKQIGAEVELAFVAELPNLAFPPDAAAWQADLAAIGSPPRGRLVELVYTRMASELRTNAPHARHLAFGSTLALRQVGPSPRYDDGEP